MNSSANPGAYYCKKSCLWPK